MATETISTFEVLQLVVTLILAAVTARQVYVTNKLDQRLYRLNTDLDQRIQRLHRAREAVIQRHKAFNFIGAYIAAGANQGKLVPNESYFEKSAELSAATAELNGLAIAIGDKELLAMVEAEGFEEGVDRNLQAQRQSLHLHRRISQLLLEATADAPAGAQDGDWRTR